MLVAAALINLGSSGSSSNKGGAENAHSWRAWDLAVRFFKAPEFCPYPPAAHLGYRRKIEHPLGVRWVVMF